MITLAANYFLRAGGEGDEDSGFFSLTMSNNINESLRIVDISQIDISFQDALFTIAHWFTQRFSVWAEDHRETAARLIHEGISIQQQ